MELFKATLNYDPSHKTELDVKGRVGKWLGGGSGSIKGEKLAGKVTWDLFEEQGKTSCETEMVLKLSANFGGYVDIIAKGFGAVGDKNKSNIWQMGATLSFSANSPELEWLNTSVATWSGNFDMKTGVHNYIATEVK